VTGGNPIAVLLQSISGVSDINPLATFYDIHGGKREVLFFYFVPDTTRDRFTIVALFLIQTQDSFKFAVRITTTKSSIFGIVFKV
jgi:hypothetical protein